MPSRGPRRSSARGWPRCRRARRSERVRHDAAGLALAARGILTQHDSRVLDSLSTIRVPTLIVVGEHDTPFLAATDYMAGKIPGATKCVLVGASHAANIDQPLAFDAAATAFLERID